MPIKDCPPRHTSNNEKHIFSIALSGYNVLHSFFYKNKVYKNVEPQICQNLKNILDAEIVNI